MIVADRLIRTVIALAVLNLGVSCWTAIRINDMAALGEVVSAEVKMPSQAAARFRVRGEFLKALKVAEKHGFSKRIVYRHAKIETADFRKVAGKHNYFGIKPREWIRRKTEPLWTKEWRKGRLVRIKTSFADFGSAEEAVEAYCQIVKRGYPDAWQARRNSKAYFKALVSGDRKWWTRPG